MKNRINNFLAICISIMFVAMFSSCKLSTEQLAKEVKISMQETWKEEGITGIRIKDFTLVHESGNKYSGLLTTIEDGGEYKYTVNVIYDGNNMKWEIEE
ncbi:MAG: hypothetical protein LBU83_05095 [Bacteroidales bacterium]|jgi:hypothetical protein|nr:hypothetical protein [Bacteroidales bacterium]